MRSEIKELMEIINSNMSNMGVSVSRLDSDSSEKDSRKAIYSREKYYLLKYYLSSDEELIKVSVEKMISKSFKMLFQSFDNKIICYELSDENTRHILFNLEKEIEYFHNKAVGILDNRNKWVEIWENVAGKKYEGEYKSYE